MDLLFIIYFALAIYFVLSLVISVFLAKRGDLDNVQKFAQIVLVWLIPYFAAIALWQFNKSQDQAVCKHSNFGGGPRDSSGAGSDGNH
ncbi:hypothetical protein [Shewanella ulleungensis]|jgi:Mn2+/Fe2+ NRAMP family transporter|uniref:Cardiolipin synthase N-terminal domain-containing protein n=1 Tax=Shewanella ulleungensis TaxID=2282699 RepID=A0ABQ2QEP5_9GAMM|nr:hypothetical protein [Shewanella ulleungensis]MCL1148636.1 hypothetical protein [Shewanella ulleungensis]GGP76581.1 hypothetical protein GCM10009410_06300 [Shewanella ulleungensis]